MTGAYRRPDVSPAELKRTLGLALDLGVDVVDTAPWWGESENICGEALRALRAWERVLLTTKVPPPLAAPTALELLKDDEGLAFRDPLPRVFPPAYVEERVERSLRATKLEVLPLVMLTAWHDSWLESTAWPELLGIMEALRRKGKVLSWGLCLPGLATTAAERALDQPVFAAIAAPHCLWSLAAERLAAAAAERELAFFASLVMGQGGLSGEILATSTFRHDDVRHLRFGAPEGLEELSRRVAELCEFTKSAPPAARSSNGAREILERVQRREREPECETVAELAVRFALSAPAVTTAVIGTSSAAHLQANAAAAARGPLSAATLEPLRALIARRAP
ncbi:MAG: aldo/keto reductase [Kofleriaceae bacterium]